MAHYSNGLPYLEDTGVDATYEVQCGGCEIVEEVDGTHYLDSETFVWECPECSCRNEIRKPAPDDPDPDEAHERLREERLFS